MKILPINVILEGSLLLCCYLLLRVTADHYCQIKLLLLHIWWASLLWFQLVKLLAVDDMNY